jgi:hypothetical protein
MFGVAVDADHPLRTETDGGVGTVHGGVPTTDDDGLLTDVGRFTLLLGEFVGLQFAADEEVSRLVDVV